MTISNFSVTPNIAAPGESIHVEFTLAVTSSDTVNGLFITGGNGSWYSLYRDNSFTLAAGKSTKIAFDTTLPKPLTYVSQNIGSNRVLVDPMWAIVLGNFGSRAEVKNPITYLNMRCLPTIANFSMERASGGKPNDEGVNVLTSLRLSMAEGASTTGMSLKLYYAQSAQPTTSSTSINLTSQISSLLTGVTNSSTLIPNTFSNGSDWGFLLVFGDSYEQTSARISLPRAFANLHLSGYSTGGACFGGFSASTQGNPLLESYYPARFHGGVEGVTNYSTGEVKTGGKWINGKPIYRQVVSKGAFNLSKGTYTTDIGTVANYSAIDQFVHIEGTIKFVNQVFPIYRMYATNEFHSPHISNTGSVRLRTVYSNVALDVQYCHVIVYYTKTTD